MSKIWRIIKHEYLRHVIEKKFLISLLSLPIMVIVMFGVAVIVILFSVDDTPVGYVDRPGILSRAYEREEDSLFSPKIEFISYADRELAQSALESEEIQAYYVIPEDYSATLQVELYYLDEPDSDVQGQFDQFMRQNLDTLQGLDPQVINRLENGNQITITDLDGEREMGEGEWYLVFTPFILGLMFFFVVMTSGGYLSQAVVEEKENRTMEIVITSVSPNQLMIGKIIGNIAVGLTQLLAWLLFGWIGIKVAGRVWPVVQDFTLSTDYVLTAVVVMLPAFLMVAALMGAIGATMTETSESQQISGLFSITMMIPYYLASPLMMNPNGTMATVLTFFPFTAPVTIMMRMSLTIIPQWQLILAIGLLCLFAVFAIWFAGKAFRMGMLRYGKKLSLKEIFRKEAQA